MTAVLWVEKEACRGGRDREPPRRGRAAGYHSPPPPPGSRFCSPPDTNRRIASPSAGPTARQSRQPDDGWWGLHRRTVSPPRPSKDGPGRERRVSRRPLGTPPDSVRPESRASADDWPPAARARRNGGLRHSPPLPPQRMEDPIFTDAHAARAEAGVWLQPAAEHQYEWWGTDGRRVASPSGRRPSASPPQLAEWFAARSDSGGRSRRSGRTRGSSRSRQRRRQPSPSSSSGHSSSLSEERHRRAAAEAELEHLRDKLETRERQLKEAHGKLQERKRRRRQTVGFRPPSSDSDPPQSGGCPEVLLVRAPRQPAASGRYRLRRGEEVNGYPIWGDGGKRLYSGAKEYWLVTDDAADIPLSRGYVQSRRPHDGVLPDAVPAWSMYDGSGWTTEPSIVVRRVTPEPVSPPAAPTPHVSPPPSLSRRHPSPIVPSASSSVRPIRGSPKRGPSPPPPVSGSPKRMWPPIDTVSSPPPSPPHYPITKVPASPPSGGGSQRPGLPSPPPPHSGMSDHGMSSASLLSGARRRFSQPLVKSPVHPDRRRAAEASAAARREAADSGDVCSADAPTRGSILRKFSASSPGRVRSKLVCIDPSAQRLQWRAARDGGPSARDWDASVFLRDVDWLSLGPFESAAFVDAAGSVRDAGRCFSVAAEGRTYDFECPDDDSFTAFVRALSELCSRARTAPIGDPAALRQEQGTLRRVWTATRRLWPQRPGGTSARQPPALRLGSHGAAADARRDGAFDG